MLESEFEKLSLEDDDGDKILIGFADTEGVPHKDESSNIWNICIIFKYVTDKHLKNVESIFHTCHFASQKKIGKEAQKPLDTYFENLKSLKDHYSAKEVFLCFWNAPHDAAVLNACGITDLQYIDLLKWARDEIVSESYSIDSLFTKFRGRGELNSLHTGLGDTVRMIKICEHVKKEKQLSDKEMLKQFFKYKYKRNITKTPVTRRTGPVSSKKTVNDNVKKLLSKLKK